VSGRFVEGAEVREEGHPFRRTLRELRIGDRIETPYRTVSQADVEHFAHFTGDTFYAHLDEAAASAHPFFKGRVAHGYLVLSFAAGLFVDPAPGPVLANVGLEGLRFLAPLYPGDAMKARLTCKEILHRPGAAWGEVRWACEIFNQREEKIASYDLLTMVAAE
jgi:oxepin-CoA hydrolase/3-oxo-5,6-dehydrosuberyl-CoA semialdehyde dehydrogenase